MSGLVRTLLWTATAAVTATAAFAQSSPAERPHHNGAYQSAAYLAHRHHGRVYGSHCCVLGPAYGQPGEPLGPALWNQNIINPRTCGPGACQDDPRY